MNATTFYSQTVREFGLQYRNYLDSFVEAEMKRRGITRDMLIRYELRIDKHVIKTDVNKISQTIECRLVLRDEP